MKRLAIIVTHPIQYYVPVFQLLAKVCHLKVLYTWGEKCLGLKYDPGFGKVIDWDVPLLTSYAYEFLENTAKDPGSHHGNGIVNPEIIQRVAAFDADAILIYGHSYQSHFKVMRHFKGKTPIWFRGDSTLLDEQSRLKDLAKKIYLKWVYSHVDKAFYVGTNNKAYFKKFGLKEEQLVFAPHAIDNERFAADRPTESLLLRQNLGLAEGDILILFAGKLEPKKNPELLAKAFVAFNKEQGEKSKEQRTKNKDKRTAHLLFVGNGILEESLKLKVKSEKLKNIHFIDFQNQTQMPVVYLACDVFCLPSAGPGESWGLAINEAMAAGKAIIASDKVGCAIDLIKHGENGFIFPHQNQQQLADALQYFVDNPKAILTFGEKSKTIIQDWSFNQQVKVWLKALHEIN